MINNIVIIGRPNVGKSTLFNRLAGKRLAIVGDESGVTRDTREVGANFFSLNFKIFDTAGIDILSKNEIKKKMTYNAMAQIDGSDLVIFLVDCRSGVLKDDFEVATHLRKKNTDVILVVNKCEGFNKKDALSDFFALGFGDPIPISAEHGQGLNDLKETIVERVTSFNCEKQSLKSSQDEVLQEEKGTKAPLQISIIGRPNSGKSTFFNLLLKHPRTLTGAESGLTRDSVGVITNWNGNEIKLFDTAGIRRKNKVNSKLEKLAVQDSLRAVNFSEIVIILLDIVNAFDTQDLKIAEMVGREGRVPIFAVNKWDLEKRKSIKIRELQEKLNLLLPQFSGAELVPISAKTGHGVKKLNEVIKKYHNIWKKRVSTSELNSWLMDQLNYHPPPMIKGRRIKIRYVTQAKTRPPTFIFFGSRSNEVPKSYERYLINSLRSNFKIVGIPIRAIFRSSENPYSA